MYTTLTFIDIDPKVEYIIDMKVENDAQMKVIVDHAKTSFSEVKVKSLVQVKTNTVFTSDSKENALDVIRNDSRFQISLVDAKSDSQGQDPDQSPPSKSCNIL